MAPPKRKSRRFTLHFYNVCFVGTGKVKRYICGGDVALDKNRNSGRARTGNTAKARQSRARGKIYAPLVDLDSSGVKKSFIKHVRPHLIPGDTIKRVRFYAGHGGPAEIVAMTMPIKLDTLAGFETKTPVPRLASNVTFDIMSCKTAADPPNLPNQGKFFLCQFSRVFSAGKATVRGTTKVITAMGVVSEFRGGVVSMKWPGAAGCRKCSYYYDVSSGSSGSAPAGRCPGISNL